MGKKSRLKKAFLLLTTPEERREIKQRRRDSINAKESQAVWIEKKSGNPDLKYHRGYIACWNGETDAIRLVREKGFESLSVTPEGDEHWCQVNGRVETRMLTKSFTIKSKRLFPSDVEVTVTGCSPEAFSGHVENFEGFVNLFAEFCKQFE